MKPTESRLRVEGFTPIELLIVIIVIGFRSATGVSAFRRECEDAKEAAVNGGTHSIQVDLAAFAGDNDGRFAAAVVDGPALADGGGRNRIHPWGLHPHAARQWDGMHVGEPHVSGDIVVPKL